MNSFLELYTSSDYRVNQRDYHLSTWEYVNGSSDYLVPFQWSAPASDSVLSFTAFDTADAETDVTGKFYDGTNLITGWTGGTEGWTIASDSLLIVAADADDGDEIRTNEFTLTAGKHLRLVIDITKFSTDDWQVRVEKDEAAVYTYSGWDGWDGYINYPCTDTDNDYTIVIEAIEDNLTVTSTTVYAYQSIIINSGLYYWYAGGVLTSSGDAFSDIFRLKISHGASDFYTDWIDPIGFTGMAKIEISSSYDYGGIKYVAGYEQWMYKRASVRRSPKATIEITGDTLNGERQNEKITSAVKYTMRMKVTESEWEALVHGMGGVIEITDNAGKVYDAQNLELADPSWNNGNAVAELSFIDGNNVNVWTRNNSAI